MVWFGSIRGDQLVRCVCGKYSRASDACARTVPGPIIATRAGLFIGPHRLAVQHRATGLALSSGRLPHPLAHGVMDSLPNSLPAPGPKVMIDRTPRGQIVGQQFPRAAAANRVTDPIDDR